MISNGRDITMNLNKEEIFIKRGARKNWAPDMSKLPKEYPTKEMFQKELEKLKAADPDIYKDLVENPLRFAKKAKAISSMLGNIVRSTLKDAIGDEEKLAHYIRSIQYLREIIYTECLENAWDLVKLMKGIHE